MKTVHVTIHVKQAVLDPQGKAVEGGLRALGFTGVENVRVGKSITLQLNGSDEEIRTQVEAMCHQLLANPVTEMYTIEIEKERVEA
ncbi:phosphoribosylformylglycinamidine synthase subunit PurS [Bacillus fonticola]|uniref:phosphoribosylformylglycinamidine synthase subunit PurS n=1 Tax=Bacillus fonticola TaxID=2728853 RepID=UPI001474D91B|nr:phosphoribosylformylglycinamidine synthase subunit PurS [Bacillus fonticola]